MEGGPPPDSLRPVDAVVIGAGHNGLVCACYLARAGLSVLVLEQAPAPGGGSRTEETVPGFRFDLHSAAHNIINMTSIPDELRLGEAGLEYREMDPFAVALLADGRRVRFHRSVERTVESIAAVDPAEADRYRAFIAAAMPTIDSAVAAMQGGGSAREVAGRVARAVPSVVAMLRQGPRELVGELLGSYGRLLDVRLGSDLTRGPVSAFAAHAGMAPDADGGAFFGLWQAAYHRHGQWHARGGSQSLADALVRRLEASGGRVRCAAPVARIDARPGRVRGVVLEDGERIDADLVVTAIHPKPALLELLDPPLGGLLGRRLAATRVSNAVQMVVHVAAGRLPPYVNAEPGDWNGLQSYVDSLDDLRASFRAAEDRRLRLPVAAYGFTPSAIDDGLAPAGKQTVYLACPTAPFRLEGGWERGAEQVVESMLEQVEARAPGFRSSVEGIAVQAPDAMAARLRWPGANPMHLDLTLDQRGPLRPVPGLSDHRTPVEGLYITGAGTAPAGGIAGLPGRAAARALLRDAGRRSRRRQG